VRKPIVSKTPVWKAVALGAGIGHAMLSYSVHAAPASGGDTVQGLYNALLTTMKNGRTLGQSGRFTQLEPVIRRTFGRRNRHIETGVGLQERDYTFDPSRRDD
jgi:hypothetical protein